MTHVKTARNPWLVAAGVIAGVGLAMVAAFTLTMALYPDTWLPAEAEVIATRVESSREGTPSWSLYADIFYETAGSRYEKQNVRVLSRSLRGDTVRQQQEWPAGKRFIVYLRSDDPGAISLSSDGGRAALAATFAILTPAFLIAAAIPLVLLAKWSARSGKRLRNRPPTS